MSEYAEDFGPEQYRNNIHPEFLFDDFDLIESEIGQMRRNVVADEEIQLSGGKVLVEDNGFETVAIDHPTNFTSPVATIW